MRKFQEVCGKKWNQKINLCEYRTFFKYMFSLSRIQIFYKLSEDSVYDAVFASGFFHSMLLVILLHAVSVIFVSSSHRIILKCIPIPPSLCMSSVLHIMGIYIFHLEDIVHNSTMNINIYIGMTTEYMYVCEHWVNINIYICMTTEYI